MVVFYLIMPPLGWPRRISKRNDLDIFRGQNGKNLKGVCMPMPYHYIWSILSGSTYHIEGSCVHE